MKYLDEYRDADVAQALGARIAEAATQPVGAHGGLRRPDALDRALRPRSAAAARARAGARPRLPGLRDLARDDRSRARHRRAAGRHLHLVRRHAARARARAAISCACAAAAPTCASSTRRSTPWRSRARNPDKRVVFFAIGFETTAPANAMAVAAGARGRASTTSRMLVSHVLVPPAIAAILQTPGNRVQGFLGPGHVCAVMGFREYEALAGALPRADRDHRLRAGRSAAGHPLGGAPARGGPRRASRTSTRAPSRATATAPRARSIGEVFEVADRKWRGVGAIPKSGYRLRYEYRAHDAERLFDGRRHRDARAPRVHQRAHPARPEEAVATARRSAASARRRRRSAPRWSRPRARAPRTTSTAAGPRGRSHERRHPPQGARERRHAAAASSRRTPAGSAPASRRWPSASRAGGRLFTMGNGGSACDAQHVAVEFQHPIIEKRRALPAHRLSQRRGAAQRRRQRHRLRARLRRSARAAGARPTTSPLGDLDLGRLGQRQPRAQAGARSSACSRSASPAATAAPLVDLCEHCFVVPSWSIHRIQETHTMLLHVLWDHLHVALGEDDVL